MNIRPATDADADAIWRIFHAVVQPGDTYVFAADTPRADALEYFLGPGTASFVALDGSNVVGFYKVIPNRRDRGSHVANASFMVDPSAQGQGIGRRLGLHCLEEAWARGFIAMQFNLVVSTNTRGVRLWQRLGFRVVGTLPGVFRHATLGDVDAYVMFRPIVDPVASEGRIVPRFGEPAAGLPVVVRPSAYALIANSGGEIALVRTSEGTFLPGGGSDPGESFDQTAIRETREECALDIRPTRTVARAADVVRSEKLGATVEKRSTFLAADFAGTLDGPGEHELVWMKPADARGRVRDAGHAWAIERLMLGD